MDRCIRSCRKEEKKWRRKMTLKIEKDFLFSLISCLVIVECTPYAPRVVFSFAATFNPLAQKFLFLSFKTMLGSYFHALHLQIRKKAFLGKA